MKTIVTVKSGKRFYEEPHPDTYPTVFYEDHQVSISRAADDVEVERLHFSEIQSVLFVPEMEE